jgi:hypothetical protein
MTTFLVDVGRFFGSIPSTSGDYAAWAQAVGSIAAILIAVAVPWWQRQNEQKDRRGERIEISVVLAQSAYFVVRDARNYLSRIVTASENNVPRTQLTGDPWPAEIIVRIQTLESREFDIDRTLALYHARCDVLRTVQTVNALFIGANPLNGAEIDIARVAIERLDKQADGMYENLRNAHIDAAAARAWTIFRPLVRCLARRRPEVEKDALV